MNRFLRAVMALMLTLSAGAACAADVPLGPGDVVKVSVYGSPDLTLETRVSESGNISYPLIGQVPVAGLSAAAAEKKIASMLESGGYLKKPQVNLIVTALQSQTVSVLGQVNRPGRYPVDGKRSVMDMLALGGGISTEGGDKVSLIRNRAGQTVRKDVDLSQMMRDGGASDELLVQGGDVVFVERAPKFYIYGEVQRPGSFRLEPSMTVTQALSAGGGLSLRGTERGLLIKRRDAQGQLQTIRAKNDDLVQMGDVLYVKESWF